MNEYIKLLTGLQKIMNVKNLAEGLAYNKFPVGRAPCEIWDLSVCVLNETPVTKVLNIGKFQECSVVSLFP